MRDSEGDGTKLHCKGDENIRKFEKTERRVIHSKGNFLFLKDRKSEKENNRKGQSEAFLVDEIGFAKNTLSLFLSTFFFIFWNCLWRGLLSFFFFFSYMDFYNIFLLTHFR